MTNKIQAALPHYAVVFSFENNGMTIALLNVNRENETYYLAAATATHDLILNNSSLDFMSEDETDGTEVFHYSDETDLQVSMSDIGKLYRDSLSL